MFGCFLYLFLLLSVIWPRSFLGLPKLDDIKKSNMSCLLHVICFAFMVLGCFPTVGQVESPAWIPGICWRQPSTRLCYMTAKEKRKRNTIRFFILWPGLFKIVLLLLKYRFDLSGKGSILPLKQTKFYYHAQYPLICVTWLQKEKEREKHY